MKTDKEKKEIEEVAYFDALEDLAGDHELSGDLEQESSMLRSIAAVDKMMERDIIEKVSPSFADALVVSLIKAKRRKSIYKLFAFVFGIFAVLIGLSWFWAMGQESITTPLYVNTLVEKFNGTVNFMTDPRFKQMFLITEAIVCLVIVEKIVSGYRMFKFS